MEEVHAQETHMQQAQVRMCLFDCSHDAEVHHGRKVDWKLLQLELEQHELQQQ